MTRYSVSLTLATLRDYGFTGRLDTGKLRGYQSHYRLRVGRYRVLFELVRPNRIIVYAILPGGRRTRNSP